METNPIIVASGKITDQIYHIDVQAYAVKHVVSTFVLETPEAILLLDTGTSDDVKNILRFLKKQGIPLQRIKYIVPSHYHFDHFGGGWKLWNILKESNPSVKVITTQKTHDQLQDTALHMQRAARTFGELGVGEMHPLPEEAYEIIDPDTILPIPGLKPGQEFKLIYTPGHTGDHCSPTLLENGYAKFMFAAEAAGTLFHSTRLITFGTSMPPEYNTETYIKSLRKLIDLEPEAIGYCHFGAVMGKENVKTVLQENLEYTTFFRDFVKKHYEESGSVRHVVEVYLKEEAAKRSDRLIGDLLSKILVALVYGQLIDLGLKEPK
nr:MBL fold metallo-hydrolase [Candidatus Sigynarchaeota archaeon]